MNPKSTIWLIALAIGLFAYIYFVDSPGGRSGQHGPQTAELLPNFNPTHVTSLEVTRSNQTIKVGLVGGQWQMSRPDYPAQVTAIESFLKAIAQLKRREEIPLREVNAQSGGLSAFGLNPPWAVVKLESGTNLAQLRIGSRTLLGDRVYFQPEGDSGICTTDASLLQHVPETPGQWRNPMLIHQKTLTFDRIAITAGSRPLKLERDMPNQVWRLSEPMAMRADFGRVEYLLQQLRGARVAQFVTDNPRADLEPYGLLVPEAEVTLALGSNTVCQIQFGKSPDHDPTLVYARRLSHTNVVLVSHELAELVQKPYIEFRDRLLVSFPALAVQRIEAQADEAFAVERHFTNHWQIVEPFRAPADQQLMQLFLKDLADLEIVRFEKDVVADFAPYGLAQPARQYVLMTSLTNTTGPTNRPLLEVAFGLSPADEPDKVFCRRADESSVYVVRFADMLRLERAAFALRDRRVWRFAASNVTAVTTLQRGQQRQILRDPISRKWDPEDAVRSAAIEETVHRLGQLQAESWAAQGETQAAKYGAAEGRFDLQLDVLEGGNTQPLKLSFGKLAPSGQPYAAVVLEQGRPVVFKFPAQLYAMVVEHFGVPSVHPDP